MKKIKDPGCKFCNPTNQVFGESESFYAIYNISPILPGHSLIVPKWHARTLFELSEAEICELMTYALKMVKVLSGIFESTGFNITIQEGVDAGQTVSHLHMHLIPRKKHDLPRPGDWYGRLRDNESHIIDSEDRPTLSDDEMTRIVSTIRRYCIRPDADAAARCRE